ncbi:MAG: metallophosphoesterase [Polyangiales bacterium]
MIPRLAALVLASLLLGGCDDGAASGRLPPVEPASFTFVVLPDTQFYTQSFPRIFQAQTRWIVAQKEARRIVGVMHVGDITNDDSDAQWMNAKSAMTTLDGQIPYLLVPGNHDLADGTAVDRSSRMDLYFPYAEVSSQPTFEGSFAPGDVANTFHRFPTPAGDFLVVGLEFGPRPEVVAWARSVLDANPGVPSIVVTHAHTYDDDTLYDHVGRPYQAWSPYHYGVATSTGVTDGLELWNGLLRDHGYVRFVFSGHVLDDGVGRVSSIASDGHYVHQLLGNYQTLPEGGGGYLRLVEVREDLSSATVRTFSPWYGEVRTVDPDDNFVLTL